MLLNMLILYYLNGHYLFSFFNAFSKEERTREDLIFNRLGENEFVDEDETFWLIQLEFLPQPNAWNYLSTWKYLKLYLIFTLN